MTVQPVAPINYDALLEEKVSNLLPGFADLGLAPTKVYPSVSTGFRLRAEFRMWHDGDGLDYAMFNPGDPKQPIKVTHFPIAAEPIQRLMPLLREALAVTPRLRQKLFQVEFLSTLSGDMLVSLVYHRKLDEQWQVAAERLSQQLDLAIVGRSRGQKCVIRRDWVDECLHVNGKAWHYRQPEQAFTQPNGLVNQHMIEWAVGHAQGHCGDLLELYCGIGNFTLPLATCFDRVIATELSKVATHAAEYNRKLNNIKNVELARLSAEEMSEAMAGTRPFRRLAHLHQPLNDYQLETLLVDPPRAGLDAMTLKLAQGFERIIYISCNPITLRGNLTTLSHTHGVVDLVFFDQFPYTQHMECGAMLVRKS